MMAVAETVENVLTEKIIGAAIEVDTVVVEVKAIEALLPVHSAQLLTYLKSSGKRVGLLINFNVTMLTKGLKRMVNRYVEPNSLPPSLRLSPRLSVSAVNREPR
jgi:hypothetical protein